MIPAQRGRGSRCKSGTVLATVTGERTPRSHWAVCLVAANTWSWIATRAFGGRTGDTLGATVALVVVVACLVLVGFWAA